MSLKKQKYGYVVDGEILELDIPHAGIYDRGTLGIIQFFENSTIQDHIAAGLLPIIPSVPNHNDMIEVFTGFTHVVNGNQIDKNFMYQERDIEEIRSLYIDDLDRKADSKREGGFVFQNGPTISTKPAALAKLNGAVKGGKPVRVFKVAKGQFVSMSKTQVEDIQAAADDFIQGVYDKQKIVLDAIMAAVTISDFLAIDIEGSI